MRKPTLSSLDYASTHRDLVERCKSGNRQAQFELYRLYSKAMYNVCLRMVRSTEDAEDILQRSFMDVFSKLDSFRYQSAVGAWIKRIVVNNCINHLKKRRLQLVEMEERFGDQLVVSESDHGQDYNVETIKRAVNKLPDGYRVVFSLYCLEGYDHKEIGDILGVSEATSKSQYSRARKKLRDMIQTENFKPVK